MISALLRLITTLGEKVFINGSVLKKIMIQILSLQPSCGNYPVINIFAGCKSR